LVWAVSHQCGSDPVGDYWEHTYVIRAEFRPLTSLRSQNLESTDSREFFLEVAMNLR